MIGAFIKFFFVHHSLPKDVEDTLKSCVLLFKSTVPKGHSDQGRFFTKKDFRDIKIHFIATDTSRVNGQIECFMRTLKNIFTIVETNMREK